MCVSVEAVTHSESVYNHILSFKFSLQDTEESQQLGST